MTVWVTELDTWQECKYKHQLDRVERLEPVPVPDAPPSPMLSGKAIHFGIEAGLLASATKEDGFVIDRQAAAIHAAHLYLDESGGERFKKGAEAAIRGVPQEIWDAALPQSETRLSVTYGDVTIVGRPDHWVYAPDAITVTDWKSTSKDESDRLERYELFNTQLKFYAVLLADHLRAEGHDTPPLYTRHLVLSTRGKHAYGSPKLLSREVETWARMRMLEVAYEIVEDRPVGFGYAWPDTGCGWCDFNPICIGHLTGADVLYIIKTQFRKRE